ncbi:hypothetical protein ACC725_08095 [Rhizobium ruizarguesonis]
MTALLDNAIEVLVDAQFSIDRETGLEHAIAFESPTVLGFLFVYDNPSQLLSLWYGDSGKITSERRFQLRSAGAKAWNTYVILLSQAAATEVQSVAMTGIEEDLSGTRKIARAGIRGHEDTRNALLSLLPLRAAPVLQPVAMSEEIKQRTTELPTQVVDAFLALDDEEQLVRLLEEQ